MLENNIKAEINISCDETQMYNHIGNMPRTSDGLGDPRSYTIKIKKKRHRTAFTTDQLLVLENAFTVSKYVDRQKRKKLADRLMIGEKNIKVWFQNRRMKNKRLSGSSCDSSSDGSEPTLRMNSNRSSDDYQIPSPHLQASDMIDKNFYPQYQQQFVGYTDYQYPTYYHHYNYQYYDGHIYNNNDFNQVWPQQYNAYHL